MPRSILLLIRMPKTSSSRIKASPLAVSKKGYFLLYSGILTAFIAGSLLLAWIVFPDVFINFIMPILIVFVPLTFYAILSLGFYYKKYRFPRA